MTKIAIFLISILFLSCGSAPKSATGNDNDTLYAPVYASHFVILKAGDTTILQVKNPWQGATDVEFEYKFTTPCERIITMSSSHSAFIEAIGCKTSVVGVSGAQFLTSDYMSKLPDVGYDNNLNFELAVALAPDCITIYEISGENSATTQKLHALGLNTIYVADYLEQNPLAKAEWIVAFGALCGDIDGAKAIFDEVVSKYNKIKNGITKNGKKVMLNSPYRDVWYLPGDSSYIVQLITDAGGQYIASGNAGNASRAVSIEVAYTMLQKSDIWLNPAAHIKSIEQLRHENPLLRQVKIPVFSNNARTNSAGGSDFWESGTIYPHLILRDIASILGTAPSDSLYYYKQIL